MCARIDKSVHWLHYGRSGAGFALGFESRAVQRSPFDLARVMYDPAEQKWHTDLLIDNVGRALESVAGGRDLVAQERLTGLAAHMVADHLWALAPRMKNPVFSEEEEWRLLTYELDLKNVPPGLLVPLAKGYRAVGNRVVPYEVFDFSSSRLPVSSIVFGASVPMAIDDPGLQFLLRDVLPGLQVAVSRSDVPVR